MLEEELFDLPADPEEAFPIVERILRERYLDDQFNGGGYQDSRDYSIKLISFCEAYDINLGVDLDALLSLDHDDFFPAFNSLKSKAEILALKYRFAANRADKAGMTPVYILGPAQKTRIHKHIDSIRQIIAAADLSEQKREALTKRLNAFAREVDCDRTRGEALMAFYVASKREIKDISDLSEHYSKIIDMLSKAKELVDALPAPKVPKLLTGPKKSNGDASSKDFEDKIPF